MLSRPGKPEVFLFVLTGEADEQAAQLLALGAEAFGVGGWLAETGEVLQIESGVVQLLTATAPGLEPS